jgi:hypothetical protein
MTFLNCSELLFFHLLFLGSFRAIERRGKRQNLTNIRKERAKQAKKWLSALEYQDLQRFYVTATSGGNLGIFPPYMADTLLLSG